MLDRLTLLKPLDFISESLAGQTVQDRHTECREHREYQVADQRKQWRTKPPQPGCNQQQRGQHCCQRRIAYTTA